MKVASVRDSKFLNEKHHTIINKYSNNSFSFKGQLEDDFFIASKSGDIPTQMKNLKDLRFDINEVDIDTGNNFLHYVLKNGNKQLINIALLLLGKKAVNDKNLANSVIQKINNEGKRPYDYISDTVVLNNLNKLSGNNIFLSKKDVQTSQVQKEEIFDDSLNKLPEGALITIPSLDDDDEFDFAYGKLSSLEKGEETDEIVETKEVEKEKTTKTSKNDIYDIYAVPALEEAAGLNKAKEILINRIIKPLNNNQKVVDSGFLIYGTAGNGKTFLLDSLQKSLKKDKIDANKFGKLVDAAIDKAGGDAEKQKKNIAEILSKNIIKVDSVQDLETVIDFAKENFRTTGIQTVIYIDEIKGILPDVSAPYSKEVTKVEQLIENSAQKGFILLATTREKDAIKPDSIRKGRFDEQIEVKLPAQDERKSLISKYLPANNLNSEEINGLVKQTSGFSYLNLHKILVKANEIDATDAAALKEQIQKYAKENNLGNISESGTTVNYDPPSLPRSIIKSPANFNEVAGMQDIKLKFQKLIIDRLKPEALERFKRNGRPPVKAGFLLYGPPGTGKTFIAKALAGETGLPLYELESSSFENSLVGESEKKLKEIFDKLETKFQETGEYSILFIDEANSILGNRENLNDFKSGLVDEFLKRLNNAGEKGIITIIATNFKDKIDKAVLSRLGESILIPTPDNEARKAIVEMTFKNVETVKNISEKDIDIIASMLAGLSARDIVNILSNTIDTPLAYSDKPLTLEDFKREISQFALSHDMPEINDRNKTSAYDTYLKRIKITANDPQNLDDLGGMEEVKKKLLEAVSFESEYPDIAERLKQNRAGQSSNVLLYGDPGCGKTFIMKALAAHLNLPLYEFKLSEQSSSFIHATTEKIGKIFNQLKEKYEKTGEKSILILDEFEDIAGRRENNTMSSHKQEETNALLKDISNASKNGIIVVAATNFYNQIDDAMKRPGRFIQINVPKPDFESRADILRKALGGREIAENVVNDEISISKLAEITEGFSVADITETIATFIKNSIMMRVEKLSVEDFIDTFNKFKEEKLLAQSKGV